MDQVFASVTTCSFERLTMRRSRGLFLMKQSETAFYINEIILSCLLLFFMSQLTIARSIKKIIVVDKYLKLFPRSEYHIQLMIGRQKVLI